MYNLVYSESKDIMHHGRTHKTGSGNFYPFTYEWVNSSYDLSLVGQTGKIKIHSMETG